MASAPFTHVENMHAGDGSINGGHVGQMMFAPVGGMLTGMGKPLTMEQVDPSTLEEEDSDSEGGGTMSPHSHLTGIPGMGPKPGKKTKGRVKIKMEFIENKLRRYTTFSKRKTGIMKKVCVCDLLIWATVL
jgi:hypothetical protein